MNGLIGFFTRNFKKITLIFLPAILILFTHFLLAKLGAYYYINWLDTPMHFFGGITIGYSYLSLLQFMQEQKFLGKTDSQLIFLLTISLVALTILTWEFFEFAMDNLFGSHWQGGLFDTMKDLFLGMVGGIIGAIIRKLFTRQVLFVLCCTIICFLRGFISLFLVGLVLQ